MLKRLEEVYTVYILQQYSCITLNQSRLSNNFSDTEFVYSTIQAVVKKALDEVQTKGGKFARDNVPNWVE